MGGGKGRGGLQKRPRRLKRKDVKGQVPFKVEKGKKQCSVGIDEIRDERALHGMCQGGGGGGGWVSAGLGLDMGDLRLVQCKLCTKSSSTCVRSHYTLGSLVAASPANVVKKKITFSR